MGCMQHLSSLSSFRESDVGSMTFCSRPELLDLPEMVQMIFVFLEPLDLIQQSRVCRLWHLIAHRLLWRNHCTLPSSIADLLYMDCEQQPSSGNISPLTVLTQTPFALSGPYCNSDKARLFQRYIPWIRSLSIEASDDSDEEYRLKRQILNERDVPTRTTYGAIFKLTDLIKLELRLFYRPSESEIWQLDQYEMLNDLIDLNAGLRAISVIDRSGFRSHEYYCVDELLRHVNVACLERLSLSAALREEDFPIIFRAFGNMALMSRDEQDHTSANAYRKYTRLDELVLHSYDPSSLHGTYLSNDLFQVDGEQCSSILGIRSLSLLDFRTHYVPALDWSISEPHNDMLLRILARCPNLETLVISPNVAKLRWPSSDLYKDRIFDIYQDKVEDLKFMAEELRAFELTLTPEEQLARGLQDELLFREQEEFGPLFALSCLKLKSIEFGGQWHITTNTWELMMIMFGQRSSRGSQDIVSMNFWGATNLSSVALRTLVLGGCMLTSLDISGCPYASEYAWAPLWNLPLLRHYRALGVPILAERLVYWGKDTRLINGYVGSEHWACEHLETLAIWIAVPVSCDASEFKYDRKANLWKLRKRAKILYKDLRKGLSKDRKRYDQRRGRIPSQINSESGQNALEEKDQLLRRRAHDDYRRINRAEIALENTPRRMQVQAIKTKVLGMWQARRLAGGSSTYFHDGDVDDEQDDRNNEGVVVDTHREPLFSSAAGNLPSHQRNFKDQVQEMVCGQIGRLSNLRSLVLEGPAAFMYKHSLYFANPDVGRHRTNQSHLDIRYEHSTPYTCMELTLHTGLGSLIPLGACLQRLEVYALEEKISRDRETVRWIAHHWGGYRAKSWEQGEMDVNEDWQAAHPLAYDSERVKDVPRAFRELIGVRCRNTVEQLKNERGKETSAHIRFNNLGWLKDRCPWIRVQTADALDAHIDRFGDASTFKE